MTKLGYHRLQLPTGELIEGPLVITIDDYANIIEWHLLDGEEPMVEWIGGTGTV